MWADLNTLPLLPDISNLTATAVLGWYAWHTVSKTIPEVVQAFRDEMAAARAECRGDREALYQELAAERQQRHNDHVAITQALDDLSQRVAARVS
jgi:hypothetical protein